MNRKLYLMYLCTSHSSSHIIPKRGQWSCEQLLKLSGNNQLQIVVKLLKVNFVITGPKYEIMHRALVKYIIAFQKGCHHISGILHSSETVSILLYVVRGIFTTYRLCRKFKEKKKQDIEDVNCHTVHYSSKELCMRAQCLCTCISLVQRSVLQPTFQELLTSPRQAPYWFPTLFMLCLTKSL